MNQTDLSERLSERDVAWLRQLTEELAEGSVIDRIMAVAERHHWHFKVERYQEMIEGEIREGNWTYIPLEQETAEIPSRAMRRIPAIERETGIEFDVIVAHEDELELTAEQIARRSLLKKFAIGLGIATAIAILVAVIASSVATPVAAAPATTTAVTTGTGTAVATAVLVALAVADPKLIIVVDSESGPVWIKICDWR